MRVLGLDIGERRTGAAVSDPDGRVATPVKVFATDDRTALARLVEDYEPGLLVVGLPVSMEGTEGAQARRTREIAGVWAGELGVRVEFFDERLTTAEAARAMAEAGLSERDMRGRVDMVAAGIMLQAYLDAERARD